jgi:hypothetical protein
MPPQDRETYSIEGFSLARIEEGSEEGVQELQELQNGDIGILAQDWILIRSGGVGESMAKNAFF